MLHFKQFFYEIWPWNCNSSLGGNRITVNEECKKQNYVFCLNAELQIKHDAKSLYFCWIPQRAEDLLTQTHCLGRDASDVRPLQTSGHLWHFGQEGCLLVELFYQTEFEKRQKKRMRKKQLQTQGPAMMSMQTSVCLAESLLINLFIRSCLIFHSQCPWMWRRG